MKKSPIYPNITDLCMGRAPKVSKLKSKLTIGDGFLVPCIELISPSKASTKTFYDDVLNQLNLLEQLPPPLIRQVLLCLRINARMYQTPTDSRIVLAVARKLSDLRIKGICRISLGVQLSYNLKIQNFLKNSTLKNVKNSLQGVIDDGADIIWLQFNKPMELYLQALKEHKFIQALLMLYKHYEQMALFYSCLVNDINKPNVPIGIQLPTWMEPICLTKNQQRIYNALLLIFKAKILAISFITPGTCVFYEQGAGALVKALHGLPLISPLFNTHESGNVTKAFADGLFVSAHLYNDETSWLPFYALRHTVDYFNNLSILDIGVAKTTCRSLLQSHSTPSPVSYLLEHQQIMEIAKLLRNDTSPESLMFLCQQILLKLEQGCFEARIDLCPEEEEMIQICKKQLLEMQL